jgi:hypothetical protein
MVRNLTTLILSGVLGSIFMAGSAEACLFKRCSCQKPAPCKVACVQPAPCVTPVATTYCAPKVKHCNFTLPKLFCHKKVVTCATPVCYAAATPVTYTYPSAQH